MHPDGQSFDKRFTYPQVNITDPLEVARWSWLLDVDDAQIRYAVRLVGCKGEAVSDYIDLFCRPKAITH